jgi:hypothetical protein
MNQEQEDILLNIVQDQGHEILKLRLVVSELLRRLPEEDLLKIQTTAEFKVVPLRHD